MHRVGGRAGDRNGFIAKDKRNPTLLIRFHAHGFRTISLTDCDTVRSMLICVGGIPGSGRKDFARALAGKLGFYTFDLEGVMRSSLMVKAYRTQRSDGMVSDNLRLRMFHHAARHFDDIAHTFRNVVVDEPLHRSIPRDFLFEAGRRSFGSVIPIWVDTDADHAEKIRRLQEKNPRLSEKQAGHLITIMARDFEPFAEAPIYAHNAYDNGAVLQDVARLLGAV